MSRPAKARARRGREPLTVLPPSFVEAPPEQREELLSALRTLFLEHLEERLASTPEQSVDDESVRAEREA